MFLDSNRLSFSPAICFHSGLPFQPDYQLTWNFARDKLTVYYRGRDCHGMGIPLSTATSSQLNFCFSYASILAAATDVWNPVLDCIYRLIDFGFAGPRMASIAEFVIADQPPFSTVTADQPLLLSVTDYHLF